MAQKTEPQPHPLEQLRDPLRLRIAICAAALLIGYFALYMPMDSSITATERQLNELRRQYAVLKDVRALEEQQAVLTPRLGDKAVGDCVQRVVDGARSLELKVLRLEPADPQRLGPLEAAVIHLDVTGEVSRLDSLLHWLDTNPLLFRVESFRIAPSREAQGEPMMQVKLLLLKEQA